MAGAPHHLDASAIKRLIYLDSNVVSILANPDNDWFLNTLIAESTYPVVSDAVLREIGRGKQAGEQSLLERFPFLYVREADPLRKGTLSEFQSAPFPLSDSDQSVALEPLVAGLMLWATGNPNAPRLNKTFQALYENCIAGIQNELADATPFGGEVLTDLLDQMLAQAGQLFDGPDPPAPSPQEADQAGFGPRRLSSLRPPRIVEQVIARSGVGAIEMQTDLRQTTQSTDDIRDQIQQVASFLLASGFARDKRLAKEHPEKSVKGAHSQWEDICHIAAAAACTVLLTADRRCARLAYATYEYLELPTGVAFLDLRASGEPVKVVGPDFWP